MDFGKEAIEKIEALVKESYRVTVDGKLDSAQSLTPVLFEPKATSVTVTTLTGFVDFTERNIDGLDLVNSYIATVYNPYHVELPSALSVQKRQREYLLQADQT